MSYCRWSSMDFKCDLYCYEHCGGFWATHVAGNRVVTPVIPDAPWSLLRKGGVIGRYVFMWWHWLHMFTVRIGIHRDIKLPHAGETFEDATLEEFKERLVWLRGLGYRFPDYVFQSVDDEIAEAAKSAMSN